MGNVSGAVIVYYQYHNDTLEKKSGFYSNVQTIILIAVYIGHSQMLLIILLKCSEIFLFFFFGIFKEGLNWQDSFRIGNFCLRLCILI